MKKITLLSVLLIAVLTSSCSREGEIFSCDQSVDAWVKENIDQVQNFNRSKILEYSGAEQRAIYRALSPSNKKMLWQEKLRNLKSIARTKEELAFFHEVEEIVNKTSFDMEWTDQEMIENQKFLDSAAEKFKWSKEFVVYAFGTLNTIYSVDQPIANKSPERDFFEKNVNQNKMPEEPIAGSDCNCNWGWCPGSSCEGSSCEETTTGCSFLLLGPCDEQCA